MSQGAPPPEQPPARGSWFSILLAAIVGLFLFVGLLLISGGGAIVVAGAGVVGLLALGFAAFHYLFWGWWLSGIIHREVAEDEDSEKKHDDGHDL
ncbi:MAG TPA: hypothetical protein VN699_20640 [Pirellulales bacterium]|nr:hypothetical protein [Pirellulales bacterium]